MPKVSAHLTLPQHQLSHPYTAETATPTFSLVAKYVLRLLQVNVLTPPSTEVMH